MSNIDLKSLPGGKPDLRSCSHEELEEIGRERKEASFRTKQIVDWLHAHPVHDFQEMTNLSAKLRASLSETYSLSAVRVREHHIRQFRIR